ncbi:MAG: hypothetical protein K2W96_08075, partial [Gemmataceae bacterium]|nr:hypothetical protein [Gemmataceae bacterium]
ARPMTPFTLVLLLAAPAPKTAYLSWSTDVNYSPDGRWLISYGTVEDREKGTTRDLGALRLGFTADGKRLFGMTRDQRLVCWDVPGFKERFDVKADHGPDFHNKAGFYRFGLVVSPDGSFVATYRLRSRTVKVWHGETGKEARSLESPSFVWSMAISPDGKLLAVGDEERNVTVWELATGKKRERFEAIPLRKVRHTSDGWVNQMCFSPDGKRLAIGVSRLGGDVDTRMPCDLVVRETEKWREVFRVDVGETYMHGLAWSPDGKQLATVGHGGIKYARKGGAVKWWSAKDGSAQGAKEMKGNSYIYGVAYHPGGKRMALFHEEAKEWELPVK